MQRYQNSLHFKFRSRGVGGHQNQFFPKFKIVQIILVIGRSNQLSLNRFFDLNTPSMRKGCDGGETRRKKKKKGKENKGAFQTKNVTNCGKSP